MIQRATAIPILAACCGITSANIYLLQPIAVLAAHHFHVAGSSAGFLASAMQITYAIGIAVFVPLVDLVRARSLLLPLIGVSTACLAAMAIAAATGSWPVFVVGGCVLGLFCPIPQIIIPAAVGIFDDAGSKLIGLLQSGLLAGILFSRFYSGLVASALSVAAVFAISCVLTAISGALAMVALPSKRIPGGSRAALIPGVALLAGLPRFLQRPATLFTCLSGLLVGVSFGMFWNSLTFFSTSWYGLTSSQIGLFGIVAGASGAMSPIAGHLADRFGLGRVQIVVCCLIVVGWIPLLWGERSLVIAVLATIFIDVGVWSNQVLNQSAIFADTAIPRGLSNTLYFTLRFLGISAGSAIGSTLFIDHHWPVVVVGAVILTLLGLVIFLWAARRGAAENDDSPRTEAVQTSGG
ncbi:MFS transporter [Nocardia alni]|uniref:MFS transporter n=1 Tax=Nocardia alni TaxID=2815723 RepID=UPI001C24D3DC|nr:MFS transporter [Nocardia alni]